MSAMYAILMGMLQGIIEFLPISSLGHITALEKFFGITSSTGILFEVMLHAGTLFAVCSIFHKDLRKICEELLGIFADLIGNLNLYIHNRRTGDHLHYARIVTDSYRKFAVLVLISMIPTMTIGYTCRRLVVKSVMNPLVCGAGLLITGILLLVTDIGKAGGTTAAKDISYDQAMWLGICQGICVFPGFSRCALTICVALLFGFSRTFAVKFSYIMSIPAIIGAIFIELGQFTSPKMTVGLGADFILGMLAAAMTGYFCGRFLLRLIHKAKFRYFAYYCFLAGGIVLVCNYLK